MIKAILFPLLAATWQFASATANCPAWFDDIAPRWLSQTPDIPGIQMSVWSPQCNLHCKGSWNAPAENYTHNPPLLLRTPSRVASVTKPFTALAVLQLVEEGKVDINGSVAAYLPDWAVPILDLQVGAENATLITPWMLLHHTAGLPSPTDDPRWFQEILKDPSRPISHQEQLEWSAEFVPALGAPGAGFRYSNAGYMYLGALIEHMTGLELGAAIREAAQLDELCMHSTYWEVSEEHPEGVPPRAGHYFGPLDVTNFHGSTASYGGTGLVSSSEDLIKFARAFHQGLLLGEQGMELTYTTVPVYEYFEGQGYGCGWVFDKQFGYDVWYHRGAFGAWMYYFPELDLALAGVMNQNIRLPVMPQIVTEIVQKLLDDGLCP